MLTSDAIAMLSLVVYKLNFLPNQLYCPWVFQSNNQLINLFNVLEEVEEVAAVDSLTFFSAKSQICHCVTHLQPVLILVEAKEEVMGEVMEPMVNLIPLAAALVTRTCSSRCHQGGGDARLLYTLKKAARPVGMLGLTNSTISSQMEIQ